MNPERPYRGSFSPEDVPEQGAEISFESKTPEQEIVKESSAEEIVAEVIERNKSKEVNPLSYFKYRGADLKIGDLKALGKFMYEAKIGDRSISDHELYSKDDKEETVRTILKEVDKMIEEGE